MKTPEHRLNILGMLFRPVAFQRSGRLGLSRFIQSAQLHEELVDMHRALWKRCASRLVVNGQQTRETSAFLESFIFGSPLGEVAN